MTTITYSTNTPHYVLEQVDRESTPSLYYTAHWAGLSKYEDRTHDGRLVIDNDYERLRFRGLDFEEYFFHSNQDSSWFSDRSLQGARTMAISDSLTAESDDKTGRKSDDPVKAYFPFYTSWSAKRTRNLYPFFYVCERPIANRPSWYPDLGFEIERTLSVNYSTVPTSDNVGYDPRCGWIMCSKFAAEHVYEAQTLTKFFEYATEHDPTLIEWKAKRVAAGKKASIVADILGATYTTTIGAREWLYFDGTKHGPRTIKFCPLQQLPLQLSGGIKEQEMVFLDAELNSLKMLIFALKVPSASKGGDGTTTEKSQKKFFDLVNVFDYMRHPYIQFTWRETSRRIHKILCMLDDCNIGSADRQWIPPAKRAGRDDFCDTEISFERMIEACRIVRWAELYRKYEHWMLAEIHKNMGVYCELQYQTWLQSTPSQAHKRRLDEMKNQGDLNPSKWNLDFLVDNGKISADTALRRDRGPWYRRIKRKSFEEALDMRTVDELGRLTLKSPRPMKFR